MKHQESWNQTVAQIRKLSRDSRECVCKEESELGLDSVLLPVFAAVMHLPHPSFQDHMLSASVGQMTCYHVLSVFKHQVRTLERWEETLNSTIEIMEVKASSLGERPLKGQVDNPQSSKATLESNENQINTIIESSKNMQTILPSCLQPWRDVLWPSLGFRSPV